MTITSFCVILETMDLFYWAIVYRGLYKSKNRETKGSWDHILMESHPNRYFEKFWKARLCKFLQTKLSIVTMLSHFRYKFLV